jgi:N-acetylmuramoyl-L-alanine amidase
MADPIIYSGFENVGISPAPGEFKWGEMKDVYAITIHHSAGPRAPTKDKAKSLHVAYQKAHIDRNFGDIGYHASMDDLGRFYLLRDRKAIGAHVGNWNSGNLGIMIHGNYEYDDLFTAQRQSIEWLFQGGFNKLFGVTEAQIDLVRGHREWSGHTSNACPGDNLMRHLAWRRSVETY